MLELDLCYTKSRLFSRKKHLKVSMPAQWSELTEKQFLTIPLLQEGLLDDVKKLRIFLGIKKTIARRISKIQTYHIFKNLRFLDKEQPLDHFVINKVLWFKAPQLQLSDVSFKAFKFGDHYYQNYLNGERKDLDKFIACFYWNVPAFYDPMKENEKGFDENLIDNRSVKIRAEQITVRLAIAKNYSLIRLHLVNMYPVFFRAMEQYKNLEKFETKTSAKDYLSKIGLIEPGESSKTLMHYALNISNGYLKAYLGKGNKLQFTKGMFLDNQKVDFPNIKIINPFSVMMPNGDFLDPNHN